MHNRFLIIFLLINLFVKAQNKVEGYLKDKKDNPISNATVIISNLENQNIISYAISSKEGYFKVSLKSNLENLNLKINSIGFKPFEKKIKNINQSLNIYLEEEITQLKEVLLKSTPINKRGDTINYSVKSFAKLKDRNIADVLKNMPGIEVSSDGRIYYQGKAINKYYIEGLDLLEGKYNLANRNLPLLWDVNVTPMLFSKKRQFLSSYQANNTGDDVASQLKTLTYEDFLEQFERNDEKQDWLAIQQIALPDLSEQRWLDNNIHLASINYLQKLKKDYELRLNISYLNDYQQQNGFTNTKFFTVNDTISLFENKYNQLYKNKLETNLTLQKNTGKNFFKNNLNFQGFWDSEHGAIELENQDINQNLSNRYFKLSNDFKTLFPLGKQIATIKSFVHFTPIII